MKQLEIDRIKRIRDLMRGQYIRNNKPRSIAELALNIGLTSAFRHIGQETLFALISQAVLVYDEDFQRCRETGKIMRIEPKWWSAWKCLPITASGASGEALEGKEGL